MRPISGVVTAMVTPFDGAGLDRAALAELVDWQIGEGCGALAACTVVGEAPTLTRDETQGGLRTCVEVTKSRVPVLAGICDSDTAACVRAAIKAEQAGVDGLVVATPPYSKPTQEGLYRHFAAIAAASRLRILVYNSPRRSVVDLAPTTLARLADLSGIAGCIQEGCGGRRAADTCRQRMSTFACDGAGLADAMMASSGWFSVVANVEPRLCSALWRAFAREDWRRAWEIDQLLRPLIEALQNETEASCVKFALSRTLAGIAPTVRLPLVHVTASTADTIEKALRSIHGTDERADAISAWAPERAVA